MFQYSNKHSAKQAKVETLGGEATISTKEVAAEVMNLTKTTKARKQKVGFQ